jgi:hypothetical protein
LEILFENPILWLVLLGVISSLFRGKKREEEGQKTRSNPVENRPTPKSGSAFGELKEIFREVNRTFQEETQPSQTLKKERVQEVIEPAIYTQRAVQEKTSIANEIEIVQKAPILQKKNQLKVDESKLVDAVIWSEILGPPRAKSPYFRSKVQRK